MNPEIWKGVQFPQAGGSSWTPNEFRIYAFHLAALYNKKGDRLVIDHSGSRLTTDNGNGFLVKMLALARGGWIAVDNRGQEEQMVVLFPDGFVVLSFNSSEDGYQRPKLNEVVAVNASYCGTTTFVNDITTFILSNSTVPESMGNVYAMISTLEGPQFKSIGHGGEHLIRENYSAGVLKNYDRIADSLQAKVPSGRINIMSGPPGTGKTYLIRGLIQGVKKAKFAIVQASHVSSLANPGMLPALLDFRKDGQPIVFVIEDAEECLATRDAGNNSAVSALLNMGDGVLGSLIDLRIVATTNSAVKDLDPAIRRPGRLSTICEVGPLTADEAWAVFDRLTYDEKTGLGKDWSDWSPKASYTIAEVYQRATDSGWKGEDPKRMKRVGFNIVPDGEEDDYMPPGD